MKQPAKVFMIADTMCNSTSSAAGKGMWVFSPGWDGSGNDNSGITVVHNDRTNITFFDGHSASVSKGDLKDMGFTNAISNGNRGAL
ncbi:hypothetical protein SDC9_212191 [bioreactor metagenome]|uniref:Uncharacterized protein n=1 Tax=bioreactor metagenome TaxID=1076179 RepID=A0A645JNT2_9ZZZZ